MVHIKQHEFVPSVWSYIAICLLYLMGDAVVCYDVLDLPPSTNINGQLLWGSVYRISTFALIIRYGFVRPFTQHTPIKYGIYWCLLLAVILLLSAALPLMLGKYFFPDILWVKHPWWFILSTYTGLAFWWLSAAYHRKVYREMLQKREMQLHEEIYRDVHKQAELLRLKYQINPHFFYNTLNFFYAKSALYSENLARGIMLLSEIMRYASKDDDSEGKVYLTKEVAQMQNYIELCQLRYDNQLHVKLDIRGNLEYRRIMPLLLLTFVENAFKFGDLTQAAFPLLIELSIKENELIFSTRNKKSASSINRIGGIGIINTRQRLQLVYPNRHRLVTQDEGDFFSVTLHLTL